MTNPSKNTDFSFKELELISEKLEQMTELWETCKTLTREQEFGLVISKLKEIIEFETDNACPVEFYVNKTSTKCKYIDVAWRGVLRELKSEMSDFAFSRTLQQLKKMRSIEEVHDFMAKRKTEKNCHTNKCEEKNPKDKFPRIFGVSP